ncbi:MAG TPA: hypothetical protein VFD90_17610 [Gaiellales bacterium]|jgi:hypothetical protein|nr:hypothetical protein [Gaiellales bacterium]
MSPLDTAGAVRPGYQHVSKLVAPGATLAVSGGLLKWYDIATPDRPIADDLVALARATVEGAGAVSSPGELGFVILHRCGDSFYFLLISTWRNENELWETVWAKPGQHEPDFMAWPLDNGHHPTFCVWELRAVCHEQAAWSRFLRSPRRAGDMDAYLADRYEGPA